MDGIRRSVRARARGRPVPRSSTELLLELATDPATQQVLADAGADADALAVAAEQAHDERSEPADWELRLRSRGGGPGPDHALASLLAIVRSADTQAYRALEYAGINPSRLRRDLIERLRSPVAASTKRREAGESRRPRPHSSAPQAPSRRLSQRPERAPPSATASAPAPARPRPAPAPRDPPTTSGDARPQVRPLDPGALPPRRGRDELLGALADAVSRLGARAPLLVGDHGCGRTLLAMHLAASLPRPVYRLLAPHYEDDEALADDLDLVAEADGVVIFDDLDRMAGDAPPAFLPALARAWAHGAPRVVTLVSPEGRARLEAWMPGVLDTLDALRVPELDASDVHSAVKAAAPAVLGAHGVTLASNASLTELTRVAQKHLVGLAMPGRALDLLDLCCARAIRSGKREVDAEAWVDVVCARTGLPRNRVTGTSDQDVLDLDTHLARHIVGHEDALEAVTRLVRRNRAGFSGARPIATVLLLGPSGVGKTEIAKVLASGLFDRDDALLRLDMSEYAEAHAVAKAIGAPPGYVGHEQGGSLTDPMLRQPHRVVLLDEIEKAHRDVHQLLLQVFDDGRLTDGRGRTVDFSRALVVMTSNLGARLLESDPQVDDDTIRAAARAAFPVELYNRIEAPLVLRPLGAEDMRTIAERLVHRSSERLQRERGVSYRLTQAAYDQLLEAAGEDPSLGARPLRHLLGAQIESRVADAILRGRVRAGTELRVDAARGVFAVV